MQLLYFNFCFGLCQLVQLVLHQCIGNDAQSDDRQDQIQNAAVSGRQSTGCLDLVEVVALFVEPVPHINAAGDDAQQDHDAAGGCIRVAFQCVHVFCQLIDPVQTVDAAGDDGQDDAERNVSLLDGPPGNGLPLNTGGGVMPPLGALPWKFGCA